VFALEVVRRELPERRRAIEADARARLARRLPGLVDPAAADLADHGRHQRAGAINRQTRARL
jgi:hypothetical protein